MNRLHPQLFYPMAFVRQAEYHVPNNKVPNRHFRFELQPGQYVLKCILSEKLDGMNKIYFK